MDLSQIAGLTAILLAASVIYNFIQAKAAKDNASLSVDTLKETLKKVQTL